MIHLKPKLWLYHSSIIKAHTQANHNDNMEFWTHSKSFNNDLSMLMSQEHVNRCTMLQVYQTVSN